MTGPADGVDIGFETGGIRDAARTAEATAAAAGPVLDRLTGLTITAGPFGRVDRAEALASGLVVARDGARELTRHVQQVHAELAGRARSTADRSEQLVADTSGIAARGAPAR